MKPAKPMEPRRWARGVPAETTFQLKDMGWTDRTFVGSHGGHILIPLPMVPDDLAIAGKTAMSLVYSYSPQVDPARSRLDVSVGGVIVAGYGSLGTGAQAVAWVAKIRDDGSLAWAAIVSDTESRWAVSIGYMDSGSLYTGAPNRLTDGLGIGINMPLDHAKFPVVR